MFAFADQLVYRYALREQSTGELYGNQMSIYLCELPRLHTNQFAGLNTKVEEWFFILKNLSPFANKPEEIGKRYGGFIICAT